MNMILYTIYIYKICLEKQRNKLFKKGRRCSYLIIIYVFNLVLILCLLYLSSEIIYYYIRRTQQHTRRHLTYTPRSKRR